MNAYDDFRSSTEDAADHAARVFEEAGDRISNALSRAARTGELSFEDMAESILQSLARVVIEDVIVAPLADAIAGLGGGSGGTNARPLTVNMNLAGGEDAKGLARSQGQVASALAQAVRAGSRLI